MHYHLAVWDAGLPVKHSTVSFAHKGNVVPSAALAQLRNAKFEQGKACQLWPGATLVMCEALSSLAIVCSLKSTCNAGAEGPPVREAGKRPGIGHR